MPQLYRTCGLLAITTKTIPVELEDTRQKLASSSSTGIVLTYTNSVQTRMSDVRDWITLLGLSLLGFAIGQDLTSVCVSLTKIQAHAAESSVMALWVVYIYLLTIAVMLPVFDQYSKILPQRKMFLYGGLAFTVGEFFITRSTNSWLLLTARVIQGVGTACLLPAIWSWPYGRRCRRPPPARHS